MFPKSLRVRPPLSAWVWILFATAASLASAAPARAQSPDRIWGRVFTTDGERHEGFLQFDRGRRAANWVDVLTDSREMPDDNYYAWLQAVHDGRPAIRTVEVKGHRVSWEERHPDFAGTARTSIAFGRLAALVVDEDGQLQIVRRSPEGAVSLDVAGGARQGSVALSPMGVRTSTTAGGLGARVSIDDPAQGEVVVRGRDVARIEFAAAPSGAVPRAARVYGSVEDRFGRTFSGLLSWSGVPVFESATLHGRDEEGDSRRIPLSEISTVESRFGGVLVTTVSGETVDLFRALDSRRQGSDVRWYRRTVRIADPGLGIVDVAWDDFRVLRLEPGGAGAGYDDFDGGGPLFGAVATRSGEEFEGWIRWDADEEWTWDYLDADSDNVEFDVEFGRIRRIGQTEDGRAHVTLLDGRSYELSGSNDVDGDNRGIFVFPNRGPAEREGVGREGTDWHYVAWENFREARFRPAPGGAGS